MFNLFIDFCNSQFFYFRFSHKTLCRSLTFALTTSTSFNISGSSKAQCRFPSWLTWPLAWQSLDQTLTMSFSPRNDSFVSMTKVDKMYHNSVYMTKEIRDGVCNQNQDLQEDVKRFIFYLTIEW